MIDHFTREQFESALPVHRQTEAPLWAYKGVKSGEHTYSVPVVNGIYITIRSSVRPDGQSAGTGEDSIRCWLEREDGKPVAPKLAKYVTRVPGWPARMRATLAALYKIGLSIKPCPDNPEHGLMRVFRVKKEGDNQGRFFQKCGTEKCGSFEWLNIQ